MAIKLGPVTIGKPKSAKPAAPRRITTAPAPKPKTSSPVTVGPTGLPEFGAFSPLAGPRAESQTLHPETTPVFSPSGPGSTLPAPSFYGADTASAGSSAEQDALAAQLAGLNAEAYNAAKGQLGAGKGNVEQDLATQLARLGRSRDERGQDISRQIDELRHGISETQAQKPQAMEDTRTKFSAGGLEFGSQKTRGVRDVEHRFDEQIRGLGKGIEDAEIQAARGIKDYEDAMADAKTGADRALADLRFREGELERGRRGEEIEGKAREAQSRAQQQAEASKRNRAEADTWIGARVYELNRSGADDTTAQSLAIDEARRRWPDVPDTYLAGALKPAKTQVAPQVKWSTERYGAEISRARAGTISAKGRGEHRAGKTYKELDGRYAVYLKHSSAPSAQGFLRYLEADGVAAGKKPAEAKALIRGWANVLSGLLDDKGLD